MKADHSILTLCRHLEVSASGYYDWQRRRTAPGPRALENQTLTQEIQTIHARSRQTYGSPRILVELRKQGHDCGRNRVARLMHEQGLCGRQKGRYRVRTTDSNHDEPIAPNRLAGAPKATAPNQIWVTAGHNAMPIICDWMPAIAKINAMPNYTVRPANPTTDDSAELEQGKFGSAEVFGGQAFEKVTTFGDIGNLGK